MGPSLQSPPSSQVLLAVEPEIRERMQTVLAGHRLTVVESVADAEKALTQGDFELIVLGVRFGESRMFELLATVRSFENYRSKPVLCVLGVETEMNPLSVEAADRAAKALLANAFLSLEHFPDDDAGNARVRRIADYLILIDGDMHQGAKVASAQGRRGT